MNDDWLAAAMTDDAVVVDLLFRLKQSPFSEACTPPPPPAVTRLLHMRLPSPSWGHRQPRSKPTASRKEAAAAAAGSSARFSPTTPLSWSGGAASPSDGGFDESSRLASSSDLTSAFRSKVNEPSNFESPVEAQGCVRKKTFGELVEEENSLLKERVHLKRELASLHVTLNQQKARSQDLKRIKIDLNMQSACDRGVGPHAAVESSTQCNNPMQVLSRQRHTADDDDDEEEVVLSDSSQNKGGGFILPDLNMTPQEDEWN